MASAEEIPAPSSPRRIWANSWVIGAGVLALATGIVWSQRITLADRLIARQLESLHLPARYRLVELGATHAVLADVSIGDAKRPDFTAQSLRLEVGLSGGLPNITALRLTAPRLRGQFQNGQLSLGSLDPLWKTPSKTPFRLPDVDLTISDGRASISSDAASGYGPIGAALSGQGNLRDGFAGQIALRAPRLAASGCSVNAALSGALKVANESPQFSGPIQLAGLACNTGITIAKAHIATQLRLARALDSGEADLAIDATSLHTPSASFTRLTGPLKLALGEGNANAIGNLVAHNVVATGLTAKTLGLSGRLRAPFPNLARIDGEGEVTGTALAPDAASFAQLTRAQTATQGTLAAPLIAQIAANLRRETAASQLASHFTFHAGEGAFSAVLPQLRLLGSSQATLLKAERLTLNAPKGAPLQISGSFSSATPGLPQITGSIERGGAALRLKMADYRMIGPTREGDASVSLPELLLTHEGQSWRAQSWRMRGKATLSGALAQGVRIANLALPLDGRITSGGEIALWPQCTALHFDRLTLPAATLDVAALKLCPTAGPILATGIGGPRINAQIAPLSLTGRMGESPLKLTTGPLQFALSPRRATTLTGEKIAVTLGQGADASRFTLASLTANLSAQIAGRFTGLDVALAPVPADIKGANGAWAYTGGALRLTDIALRVKDREQVPRFAELAARNASLTLYQGVITADATLREPISDRAIVRLAIGHDLASAKGHADLALDGLTFDKALQPDRLSALVQGTIANAQGRFDGSGRIDWQPDGKTTKLTSSATIATKGFDFAGMVGPVKGVAGTVQFTDLLGLVTAPHQRLTIGAINPGIEATDGTLDFSMEPGYLLVVDGASWPFMDGTMEMSPARLQLGGTSMRRFEMRLAGVNAAKFLAKMEVNNLSASGIFDGRVPLVFDQNGGRVVGGELASRPPGGMVSYVGELSYRDLSPMANYAFQALRSLKFSEMRIGLDGDLAGDVVTRVAMQGLGQGETAKKNFLTRQIAKIPLQFNVNIHAPFYQMFGSLRSLYDTTYVGDPREKGLNIPVPPKTPIQPPVSEQRP